MKKALRKIINSRIFRLFEILVFIAVCIGVGSVMAYVQHESDPTEQAVVYFRAFVQRDFEKMYNCLDLNQSYYLSKNMYIERMKSIREKITIDSYKIREPEKKNGMEAVTIECEDLERQTSQEFVVYLTAERDSFQMIPEYHINIDEMMVRDFSVTIPKGDSLELNGEKVTDKMADIKDGNSSSTYTFAYILNGQYKVASTNEFCAKSENIKLTVSGTKVDLIKKDYTSNDKYTKIISESGENVIGQFYQAVRERKPSQKKLMKCFSDDKKLKKKVEELVKKSQDIVYWPDKKNIEKYHVTEMNMSKLKKSIRYDAKKEAFTIVYNYSYEYVSQTETALYSSYVYKLLGKCKSTMELTYSIKDDKLVLSNIKMTNKNKKNGE